MAARETIQPLPRDYGAMDGGDSLANSRPTEFRDSGYRARPLVVSSHGSDELALASELGLRLRLLQNLSGYLEFKPSLNSL